MITKMIEDVIYPSLDELMIKADNVANVVSTHSLSNGLLVLSQVKYSLIPVLSPRSTLVGLVGMPNIINKVTTLDGFDMNLLDEYRIEDLELHEAAKISKNTEVEVILKHLIDHNFVCVVDPEKDDLFIGIVTRKSIMKRVNYFLHQISIDDNIGHLISIFDNAHLSE